MDEQLDILTDAERRNIGTPAWLTRDRSIRGQEVIPMTADGQKVRELLNEIPQDRQNSYEFPAYRAGPRRGTDSNALEEAGELAPHRGLRVAQYDYRIDVGDDRYPLTGPSLEDKLMNVRASVGLPVHGRNDIAKAMKYYMYNRFKSPDTNLAHNKSFTHVFFTRPDLNLLNYESTANEQVRSFGETNILWQRNPELFKLLTEGSRCKDNNNFNLLLSNQITSFDIQDEMLSTQEAGKSWAGYEMIYGDQYNGRTAGEFSCGFTETQDYSIINLIKLWITYIDNVAKGAWKPSYNLKGDGRAKSVYSMEEFNLSHVFSKTLDYASSCYVFKCGPDGEEVLYWSKYYGVFPINTGAQALSWELAQNIGDAPKLNIRFKYSFKRDLSPVSLIEFNDNAGNPSTFVPKHGQITNPVTSSVHTDYSNTVRPYVGCPFLTMEFRDPVTVPVRNGAGIGPSASSSKIRLKFRNAEESDTRLSDRNLYRATLAGSNHAGSTAYLQSAYRVNEDIHSRTYEDGRVEELRRYLI